MQHSYPYLRGMEQPAEAAHYLLRAGATPSQVAATLGGSETTLGGEPAWALALLSDGEEEVEVSLRSWIEDPEAEALALVTEAAEEFAREVVTDTGISAYSATSVRLAWATRNGWGEEYEATETVEHPPEPACVEDVHKWDESDPHPGSGLSLRYVDTCRHCGLQRITSTPTQGKESEHDHTLVYYENE